MTDIARLRKVLEYVETLQDASQWTGPIGWEYQGDKGQDAWYQGTWFKSQAVRISEAGVQDMTGKPCGSAACLGGHTVLMFGQNGTMVDGDCAYLPDGSCI